METQQRAGKSQAGDRATDSQRGREGKQTHRKFHKVKPGFKNMKSG